MFIGICSSDIGQNKQNAIPKKFQEENSDIQDKVIGLGEPVQSFPQNSELITGV